MSPRPTSPLSSGPAGRVSRLPEAGTLGMYLLVGSLGMFFTAGVVGYLVMRSAHQPWPPPGFPVLPRSLWLSVLLIVTSSLTMRRAVAAVRRGDRVALHRAMVLTLALGLAFLASQIYAWVQIAQQLGGPMDSLGQYVKLFYVLSGLHALHVVGGLGPMVAVTRRARECVYGRDNSSGVRYMAIYWHFLDVVWCVLFIVVYLL